MGRKHLVYKIVLVVWLFASVGVILAAYDSSFGPDLPQPPQFAGRGTVFVVIAAAWVGGLVVLKVVRNRDFHSTGRQAGLEPTGSGLLGLPDMTGTVRGRTVRVRTVKRKLSSTGGSQGSSKEFYTVVEADLDRPAEAGVIVTPASGARTSSTRTTVEVTPEEADVVDQDLAAVGTSEAVTRAVLSGRSREALLALDDLDLVYVGNAAAALGEEPADTSDSMLGSMVGKGNAVIDRIPGDADRVSVETYGLVLDADRLRRQAEAVAAVAEAFEEATREVGSGRRA